MSGLGEACLDRAPADPAWVAEQAAAVAAGHPQRAKEWARLAVQRADLHLRWADTADGASALVLERTTLTHMRETPIWNRAR